MVLVPDTETWFRSQTSTLFVPILSSLTTIHICILYGKFIDENPFSYRYLVWNFSEAVAEAIRDFKSSSDFSIILPAGKLFFLNSWTFSLHLSSTMRFAKLWKCSAILSPRIFADLHSKTGHLYLSLLGWKGPGKGPVLFNPFLFYVMFETNTKFNV